MNKCELHCVKTTCLCMQKTHEHVDAIYTVVWVMGTRGCNVALHGGVFGIDCSGLPHEHITMQIKYFRQSWGSCSS